MQFSSCSAIFSPHSNLTILQLFYKINFSLAPLCRESSPAVIDRESSPAVVECVGGVVVESSLVGEVTPPGLRGEGGDRVRANNLG